MNSTQTPTGFASLNPFFITRDAAGLHAFLRDVFGGQEHPDARTVAPTACCCPPSSRSAAPP